MLTSRRFFSPLLHSACPIGALCVGGPLVTFGMALACTSLRKWTKRSRRLFLSCSPLTQRMASRYGHSCAQKIQVECLGKLLHTLSVFSFVVCRRAGADHSAWALTPHGRRALHISVEMTTSKWVLGPLAGVAIDDMTVFELIIRMKAEGWTALCYDVLQEKRRRNMFRKISSDEDKKEADQVPSIHDEYTGAPKDLVALAREENNFLVAPTGAPEIRRPWASSSSRWHREHVQGDH